MDVTSVQFTGRLTKDAEQVTTKTGTTLARFSVATNFSRDTAHFFDCTVFGRQSEWVAGMKKGDRVAVHGRLSKDEWQGNDGKKYSKLTVIANDVVSFTYHDQPASKPVVEKAPAAEGDGGEDIPF